MKKTDMEVKHRSTARHAVARACDSVSVCFSAENSAEWVIKPKQDENINFPFLTHNCQQYETVNHKKTKHIDPRGMVSCKSSILVTGSKVELLTNASDDRWLSLEVIECRRVKPALWEEKNKTLNFERKKKFIMCILTIAMKKKH